MKSVRKGRAFRVECRAVFNMLGVRYVGCALVWARGRVSTVQTY